jgi:hypothetical protein
MRGMRLNDDFFWKSHKDAVMTRFAATAVVVTVIAFRPA